MPSGVLARKACRIAREMLAKIHMLTEDCGFDEGESCES